MPQGAVGVAPQPNVGGVAQDFEAQKRRTKWTAASIGAAALVAGFFGLRALGFLRLGASSHEPGIRLAGKGPAASLQMPGYVDPPALQQSAHTTPPPLQQGATRKQMPPDVEAWLKHLEECERRKAKISSDQVAEAMVFMQKIQALGAGIGMLNSSGELDPGSDENKDPSAYARDKVLDFRSPWDDLVAYFNSVPPPEECKPLAADFNHALSEVPGVMGDLASLLNSAASDPTSALKKANGMKNASPADIDRYFGSADKKLGAICSKYDTTKWFDIKTDVGGGALSMFGGLGGGGGLGSGLGQ